jgi:hypothetical protein
MQPEMGSRNDGGTTSERLRGVRAGVPPGWSAALLRRGLPPDGVASSSPDSAAVGPTAIPATKHRL